MPDTSLFRLSDPLAEIKRYQAQLKTALESPIETLIGRDPLRSTMDSAVATVRQKVGGVVTAAGVKDKWFSSLIGGRTPESLLQEDATNQILQLARGTNVDAGAALSGMVGGLANSGIKLASDFAAPYVDQALGAVKQYAPSLLAGVVGTGAGALAGPLGMVGVGLLKAGLGKVFSEKPPYVHKRKNAAKITWSEITPELVLSDAYRAVRRWHQGFPIGPAFAVEHYLDFGVSTRDIQGSIGKSSLAAEEIAWWPLGQAARFRTVFESGGVKTTGQTLTTKQSPSAEFSLGPPLKSHNAERDEPYYDFRVDLFDFLSFSPHLPLTVADAVAKYFRNATGKSQVKPFLNIRGEVDAMTPYEFMVATAQIRQDALGHHGTMKINKLLRFHPEVTSGLEGLSTTQMWRVGEQACTDSGLAMLALATAACRTASEGNKELVARGTSAQNQLGSHIDQLAAYIQRRFDELAAQLGVVKTLSMVNIGLGTLGVAGIGYLIWRGSR